MRKILLLKIQNDRRNIFQLKNSAERLKKTNSNQLKKACSCGFARIFLQNKNPKFKTKNHSKNFRSVAIRSLLREKGHTSIDPFSFRFYRKLLILGCMRFTIIEITKNFNTRAPGGLRFGFKNYKQLLRMQS